MTGTTSHIRKSASNVVVVADADPNVRDLVGHFLTEAGYTVSFETDGYDVLDNARKSPPLAILADVLLPRLDGLTLCKLLKEDSATAQIVTVIVFSVLAAEERARKAGADAFLKKPLERTRVLKALDEATKRVIQS